MKIFNQTILLATIAFMVVACKDTKDVRQMAGNYSYKTSGTVWVGDSVRTACSLLTEVGQLSVLSMHNGDSVILTFNSLLGDAYTARGAVDGKELRLAPFTRRMKIQLQESRVKVVGHGKLYDRNLVIDWTYSGMTERDSATIVSEEVTTVAKLN